MSIHLILTLVTLLVVVIMFLSGKFNFGWIGMFCATFLCATGVLSFKDAYANFASTNVVMVGAMFILAGALGKTTLVDHVRNWIMSKGTSGRSIVFLYLLGSILLTQLVSPLGVIAMLLPLTAALDENSPVQPSQLLYPRRCLLPRFSGDAAGRRRPDLLRHGQRPDGGQRCRAALYHVR